MSIDQSRIIENLNRHLDFINDSRKVNEEGICHGLALLHAKSVLENKHQKPGDREDKEEAFFKKLNNIANLNPESKLDEETEILVKEFVSQVIMAFNPKSFYKNLSQAKAYQMVKINGQPLESSFKFALCTSIAKWAELFKELDIREGEVVQVSSADHTVSVHKKKGKYCLYDPNSGRKYYNDEKALMAALHKSVFNYKGQNLGLTITFIRLPNPALENQQAVQNIFPLNNRFPKPNELYKKYLLRRKNGQACNSRAETSGGAIFSTFSAAAASGDEETLTFLYNNYQFGYLKALRHAIWNVNTEGVNTLLPYLLKHINKEGKATTYISHVQIECTAKQELSLTQQKQLDIVFQLAREALKAGSFSAYQVLELNLSNMSKLMTPYLALAAAQGGDLDALNHIMKKLTVVQNKDYKGKILNNCVKNGNLPCINYLLEQNLDYTPKEKADFLLSAIQTNDSSIVDALLSCRNLSYTKDIVNSINISTLAASRTNLHILKILRDNGKMEWNAPIQLIMQRKEKQTPISLGKSISIVYYKLTDTIKEWWTPQKSMYINVRMFKPRQIIGNGGRPLESSHESLKDIEKEGAEANINEAAPSNFSLEVPIEPLPNSIINNVL